MESCDGNLLDPHLLLFFVLRSGLEYGRHVLGKAKRLQGLGDMVARYGLLRFFFRYVIGLARDEGDELNAAFYKKVTSFLRESYATRRRENFGYDFLNRSWDGQHGSVRCDPAHKRWDRRQSVANYGFHIDGKRMYSPLGKDKSSFPNMCG